MWKRVGASYFDAKDNEKENATVFDDAFEVIGNITEFIHKMSSIEMEVELTYNKNYFSETNTTADGQPKKVVSVRKWSRAERNDLTSLSLPSKKSIYSRVNISYSVCDESPGFYN